MCLSTVFEEVGGQRTKVCEYVSGIKTENDKVTLTDIMGSETVVFGTLKSMDFIKNVIIIEGNAQ